MTRVLGIDTSTREGRVALVEQTGSLVVSRVELAEPMVASHATHLLLLVDRALAQAGWDKRDLEGVAVVRGPGSFTGVRIALGTVQGLVVASGIPCHGVNTLEALAEASGPCPAARVVVLAAGRGELYVAHYDAASSPPHEISSPTLVEAETFWRESSESGEFVLWAGGAEPSAPLPDSAGREASQGTAAAAARIALARGFDASGSLKLSPLYVRPSDAELKRRP